MWILQLFDNKRDIELVRMKDKRWPFYVLSKGVNKRLKILFIDSITSALAVLLQKYLFSSLPIWIKNFEAYKMMSFVMESWYLMYSAISIFRSIVSPPIIMGPGWNNLPNFCILPNFSFSQYFLFLNLFFEIFGLLFSTLQPNFVQIFGGGGRLCPIEGIHFTHAWSQTKEVIPVVFPIQSI